MGTRADFYIGKGASAEWLGSIAYDGYPGGIPDDVLEATNEEEYRAAVAEVLKREDGTTPDMGWPWPWTDSTTTDFAYALDGGRVWCSCFGSEWYDPFKEKQDPDFDPPKRKVTRFPDMTHIQKVAWDKRSGVIFVRFRN